MSRGSLGVDPIPVRPTNNVYTVLVIAASIVNVLALIVLMVKYNAVFGGWPFTTGT
jgi:hypothetical protein